MTKRIGFACKWIDGPSQIDGIKQKDNCKQYNTGSTTVAWLNRQTKPVAEQKLWDLMVGNIEAVRKLVEKVGTLDENLRMVRLSSIYCLYILSLIGSGFGGSMMSEPIAKEIFRQWVTWPVRIVFGLVFIPASLLCLLAIVQILSIAQ